MLTQPTLDTLLALDIPADAPEVLIYSEQASERLNYACGFIFRHVLKLRYVLMHDLTEFNQRSGYRINYSNRIMDGILQLQPQGLLSERGTEASRPKPVIRNKMLYLYDQPGTPGFPYDLFSAVFYFISRYEEWQAFEADVHQRFEAKASFLYQQGYHLKPVVDIWIDELSIALQQFYPDFKLPQKEFRVLSTIDVDNLYAYRAKGLLRTLGASIRDLLKADLKNLKARMLVIGGRKKDPFDIYAEISDFCFERRIPLIYFFLFRTGTAQDRTVNPGSDAYLPVFKTLKENHALIGLHPSYHASENKKLLAEERNKLSQRSGEELHFSRQHFLRFNIRTTPGLLMEQGFTADFSMGFASAPGFRAGTSHPFYYYDFVAEQPKQLLFVPFCVMDGVYTIYEQVPPEPAFNEMLLLAKEVKKTKGLFISVFHERTFSDHLYKGFGSLYKKLHSTLKEL